MTVPGFRTTIGLEVHVQLAVRSKLFSTAAAEFGGEPNSRVSVVDLGLPGVLPVLNDEAIRHAVVAALALEGDVRERSWFDRKNYFYPDLPKGYQISQFYEPYCVGGRVPLGDGRFGELERIHLEEDAGKLIHEEGLSLVDLNRAGTALIEIVGRPDLHEPEDAARFLEHLKEILQYVGASDCDMEKGSLRCDANISLAPAGASRLGTKVEIKNMNSFKAVQRALEYEERRQAARLAGGSGIVQETRLWNEERGETASMRRKESAQDYRYFPDPDLPPLAVTPAFVAELRRELPELPLARRQRYRQALGLPDYDVGVLTAHREVGDYFEALAAASGDVKAASNWVMTEVSHTLHERGIPIACFPIPPARLADLVQARLAGRLNNQGARKVFVRMLDTAEDAGTAIAALGLEQITDPEHLLPLVAQALEADPRSVEAVRSGKVKALDALKGRVMQATRGRADPRLLDQLLRERLGV